MSERTNDGMVVNALVAKFANPERTLAFFRENYCSEFERLSLQPGQLLGRNLKKAEGLSQPTKVRR